ncbi:ABC transporter ATP-binding protein [Paractinoplanes brasiliensis]|uniref:Amino acid/amide ABC transporter ATP-binding protein 2 (HAAT family) n=1 Tax=Paractinoplanes brasiliensis TaxID=52695 RepID=A0A4R6JLU6_9ACTN|nr:ABC transporter ATP-binding protein [Actinoplanes brasiliensis]TDO37109.1 amino acid/amide ABC transporter ATP-binding protein 2 (HAAT family) [Actinoplanes brasiliensis]GID32197.1 ABC transporter ATP-binding protein [Actinoplanes brasiliensis]
MSGTDLLELSGLVAGYGRIVALHGVSLTVRAGEVVCLIGRNGAGKSTLLKTVAGLVRPTGGRVLLRGQDISGRPVPWRTRAGVALVPEGRRVFAPMSVHDNLLLGGYGRARKAIAAGLADTYDRFPRLAERRGQPAGTLSGGEQQMLAIGRALMSAPSVILLDEPSLGLAPRIVAEVGDIITGLAGAEAGVLLVEQDAAVAFRLADRGYLLDRGHIITAGPTATLRDDARVRSAYLGAHPAPGKQHH